VDDLYSLGYVDELLRRDQVDRALVTFYGKLAQGLTPDTFIGGEASGLEPLDRHGRGMYLPPNSAGNGLFLWTLRNLLVQDWDLDDDGKPDTLRLLFATPRPWMDQGKVIQVHGAPTAFGPLSLEVRSRLEQGEIDVQAILPPRPAKRILLRARVPAGWAATAASVGDRSLPVDENGTVDLSGHVGQTTVRFHVRKASCPRQASPNGQAGLGR
jgi:hypothetical protein